jgi:glycosyltransferase involved in cell wall biosynthesis
MSTDQPTVTIITPAYNVARFLSQTIESALAQTFGDFELLISDDGSTDETLEVARGWERVDPRIRVIVAPNGGSATARNRAMKEARGSYFALLDSDDLWQPGFLAAQLAIFHQNPDADVVTANAYNMGGSSDGRPLKPVGVPCRKLTLLEIVENEDAICIMSVFRRAVGTARITPIGSGPRTRDSFFSSTLNRSPTIAAGPTASRQARSRI